MALLLVAAVIALGAVMALGQPSRRLQRPFPWMTLLVCAAAFLLVRLGIKWAPLAIIGYFAWTRWSRITVRAPSTPGARAGSAPHEEAKVARMSREDACRVLGVSADATPQQILAEYRRLMKRVHPDAGGSEDLAARVNEAKTVLLG